jgi:2-methylcitrate dehydratase PrpD
MPAETTTALAQMAAFAAGAAIPDRARNAAATAVVDTIGVALAGASEPAARAVQSAITASSNGRCTIWGTRDRAAGADAALANGTAAHALDYDDMCFVSLAHPSAPLVPAIVAAAEQTGASGRALLDAYVAGFEIQARLGRLMNPRHYQRGWHCTSTLGAISAAAGAARLLGLDAARTAHALAIAASSASGLKENFGTMVKPLHAGLAARDGVLAALLARDGLTGSAKAFDGPQGFLHAFDSAGEDLAGAVADLGARWEIVDTGITVKLYPSCAGTHPALDVVLNLKRAEGFSAGDVERIDVDVDRITPTILIHDRPSTGLEAKFSMPYCVAAAVVHGRIGLDTFEDDTVRHREVTALLPRISMRVDPAFDNGAPALTQSRVTVALRNGTELGALATGARGYPHQPASDVELREKFVSCARRALMDSAVEQAWTVLRDFGTIADVTALTSRLAR